MPCVFAQDGQDACEGQHKHLDVHVVEPGDEYAQLQDDEDGQQDVEPGAVLHGSGHVHQHGHLVVVAGVPAPGAQD